jgi:hypothetical protein
MGALAGMYGFQSSTVGSQGPFATIRGIASWADLRADCAPGNAWVRILRGTAVAWEGPGDAMPERDPNA